MPEASYLVVAVLVSAGVTWGLRALPFTFLGRLRSSELLAHVGDGLPVGVMLILVLHTVRETELGDVRQAVPVAVGLAVTGGLHLWRGNALLSIFSGTAAHVVLASALW